MTTTQLIKALRNIERHDHDHDDRTWGYPGLKWKCVKATAINKLIRQIKEEGISDDI